MDEFARREPTRRTVVAAIGLAPVASLAPSILAESKARAAHGAGYRFFDAHQAAVVKAAAARLVPGPHDDPVEALLGSPGATEADVVRYIDTMLSAFDFARPRIFAGGPWSNRHGGKHDYMKRFVKLAPRQRDAWHRRIKLLRRQYAAAVKSLDAAVSTKNFATASALEQDNALTKLDDVRDLIFGHTIEGMYSVPEYGGNRNLVGWHSISWPGDTQPRGYTPDEVERNDGADVVLVSGIVARVLDLLPDAAQRMAARGWPRG
ncbi:MAG TPA: gluconate 2-dehydrogenase subunit 3 family protein [Mycobacteriales bacterium]|nr:gluconate 2-dehydrogenase subunit 3 family protein [Mycobacteriales bacterium]